MLSAVPIKFHGYTPDWPFRNQSYCAEGQLTSERFEFFPSSWPSPMEHPFPQAVRIQTRGGP
jgi:hypothetical protein